METSNSSNSQLSKNNPTADVENAINNNPTSNLKPEDMSIALPENQLEPYQRGQALFDKYTAKHNPFVDTVLNESNSESFHKQWTKLRTKYYEELTGKWKVKNEDIFTINLIEKLEKVDSLLKVEESSLVKKPARELTELFEKIKDDFKNMVSKFDDGKDISHPTDVGCTVEQYQGRRSAKNPRWAKSNIGNFWPKYPESFVIYMKV